MTPALKFCCSCRYAPPSIASLSPSVIPTVGAANVVILGNSFGDCTGVSNCFLRVTVSFPEYTMLVDMSDVVCSRHTRVMQKYLLQPNGSQLWYFRRVTDSD